MTKQHNALIDELVKLLEGGSAHVSFKNSLKGLPAEMRGVVTNKLPYSIWQIVEHIRIAQWDMLEFSKDGSHESPKWPDDYWQKKRFRLAMPHGVSRSNRLKATWKSS